MGVTRNSITFPIKDQEKLLEKKAVPVADNEARLFSNQLLRDSTRSQLEDGGEPARQKSGDKGATQINASVQANTRRKDEGSSTNRDSIHSHRFVAVPNSVVKQLLDSPLLKQGQIVPLTKNLMHKQYKNLRNFEKQQKQKEEASQKQTARGKRAKSKIEKPKPTNDYHQNEQSQEVFEQQIFGQTLYPRSQTTMGKRGETKMGPSIPKVKIIESKPAVTTKDG